jgi:uncharacterized protein YyaL (SSP411 family)
MERYAGQYPNWLHLALWLENPFYEVVITGPEATEFKKQLLPHYLPNSYLASSARALSYPLFENRHDEALTRIFLCEFGQCLHPLSDIEEVLPAIDLKTKN